MRQGTALVTGASSGIGAEIAEILAGRGYDLIVTARRKDRLEELARSITNTHGVTVRTVVGDLSDSSSLGNTVSELTSERVDILVNNAGFGLHGRVAEADPERLSAMIELNVNALTRLTRAVLPGMIERRQGRILQIASVAAFQPGPLMAAYYASKAYVLSFSEALAVELEGSGVVVTTICPGPTVTEFHEVAGNTAAAYFSGKKIPNGRDLAAYSVERLFRASHVAIHGARYKFLVFVQRFLPRRFVARIVLSLQKSRGR
ncbi:MAG: SDR family oxidoreductase [Spirochaetaceae bacterium]|nr:MAG: SDR family oxidoreductase [Spirochaetaceae bacterium]